MATQDEAVVLRWQSTKMGILRPKIEFIHSKMQVMLKHENDNTNNGELSPKSITMWLEVLLHGDSCLPQYAWHCTEHAT